MKRNSHLGLSLLTAPRVVLAISLVGCGNVPTRPQNVSRGDYDGIKTYARQLIRHEMERNRVIGPSTAHVDDPRVVWAEGFGYADKERQQPVSDNEAILLGPLADGGGSLRCLPSGDGERCTYAGYTLKKIAP